MSENGSGAFENFRLMHLSKPPIQNTLLRFIKRQTVISRQLIPDQKQLCLLKLITVLKALNVAFARAHHLIISTFLC